MEKKFGIKVISNSCGILPHTLRVWEQRYQVFNPERSARGQRLYSESDLHKAKLLSKLLEHGHSISSLSEYSVEELESMASILKDDDLTQSKGSFKVNLKPLMDYLSDYKIEMIANELQHLRISVGVKQFIFNVVLPVMRQIGLMVAKGDYSVTQEHIISTIVREQLSHINLSNMGSKYKEMIMASPEGNLHELPILIADILCRTNKVNTRYLGAAHPAECLAEAVNALKSPYLVLGVVSSDQWSYSKKIIPYLTKLDSHLVVNIEVILGGGSPLDLPQFEKIKNVNYMQSLESFNDFLEELP